MRRLGNLAVIGSGPSALYFLQHLAAKSEYFIDSIDSVVVFEKSGLAGYGMPYHPETTDRYNRSNISSEELPPLPEKFADWLKTQDKEELQKWGITPDEISESEVYCRLALGEYFHEQFFTLAARLEECGIPVEIRTSSTVTDLADCPGENLVKVFANDNPAEDFNTLIVATGHYWNDHDKPEQGYYSSPWPIFKLLPEKGEYLNHSVGTLGASLSAFDVISSLSVRHGDFRERAGTLEFEPFEGTEKFEIVMHSAEGWLPHLQWDQVEPFREIYRHISRSDLFSIREKSGYLRLERFFDHVCRPALIQAFEKDSMSDVAALLRNQAFGLEDFVEEMSGRHEYIDSFEGMRKEMTKARDSVEKHHPIHWKEILDDLMFCLNYHAELLPAEDHILFKKTVMPFLMNVIAAMPLESADMLLALHDAGKVRLIEGKVTIKDSSDKSGKTVVVIENGDSEETAEYRTFVDCSGQSPMELKDFPFSSLAENSTVREARADFLNPAESEKVEEEKLIDDRGEMKLRTGGMDVDASFRLIGKDCKSNPRIHDISFPHTSGVRPYSYGLQACDATASIVVNSWVEAMVNGEALKGELVEVSRTYEMHDPT
ncbi:FAD/NAD(P)-binding protein [Luteolibacter sp. AS25]|uniref:FAD/NAD(P)-binding protein n=1 Tax=Luteolibacter sp. AS25 TaxID=3135776 RepID=UPI00398A98C2